MTTLTDDDLLEFDRAHFAHWNEDTVRRLLVEHPQLFRDHLAIAKWIDHWSERMQADPGLSDDYHQGFVAGIREIAKHLRLGDLVPGGSLMRPLAKN
jgi:hypothetical protein